MYNGIGLQTPRGSGTNGYVQRNMSFVQKSREKVSYKTEEDIKKLDALANKKPNQGILAHERKRMIELKCLEMQELMEDQGYPDDEIESKVALFRKMLMDKEKLGEKEIPKDDFGRPVVKESHQIAEANQEKNCKMREALGISQYFVEGSSLDPERKVKEAAAAAVEEAKKKYTLIADSSSSSSPERSQGKEKDQKRKKKSHSSHEKMETSPKKKKSGKKHKRERSNSPEALKKKKSKKPVKEKTRLKSKTDSSRRKDDRSSSSSSSSSSESAESSSGSSSRDSNSDSDSFQDKHKNSSKREKNHKMDRKRSTSSERIRYSKDARSRKDIYEAKKAKYKRKSTRTSSSSSSDDSSPKQYYRLEPVLLKSKSKHKKSRQIIEIPKKSAFELKKYDKKKRVREPSSSDEEMAIPESKRHKRSGSHSSKASKHRSDRDEEKIQSKMDSHRSSKRSEKNSHVALHKHPESRSRSGLNLVKSHHKGRFSEEESDDNQWKHKERSRDNMDKRNQEKEIKNKKKHNRNRTDSPKQHNGYSKHKHRSLTRETEYSERSGKSESIHKHEKYTARSPSHSPVVYKNKKHIIETSPVENSSTYKKKCVPKSPSYSPPKKGKSKSHRSRKVSIDSYSRKGLSRHDTKSRSPSPVETEARKNGKVHKASTKGSSKSAHIPRNTSHENKSLTRSPSQHKSSKAKTKQRSNYTERSDNESMHSDQSNCLKSDSENASRNRKPKECEKPLKSCSNSPVHHKSSRKSKKKRAHSEESSPDEAKTTISKSKEGMVILSETCQITATEKTTIDNQWKRESSNSNSPFRSPSREDSIKQKRNRDTTKQLNKTAVNKNSPDWSSNKVSSPKEDKSKSLSTKCNASQEVKIKKWNKDKTPDGLLPGDMSIDHDNEDTFNKKNNWNVVLIGDHSQNADSKNTVRNEKNSSPVIKEAKIISKPSKKNSIKQQQDLEERPTKRKDHSRSASENTDQEKNSKNKERIIDGSRSCSRSTSAHSVSGSERSSRSGSYSCRTKSYSKSRSPSYSKSRSRSRSKSRSKSRSRSHSKSYSRSRSRSVSNYSRSRSRSYSSRSRSRSIARSPSIPRRRGSPSFLDKRRITS